MKIVVGLGNPGQEYSATRHNVGFMTIDVLHNHWKAGGWRNKFDALVAEHRGVEPIILVKPQTYMNNSGYSVNAILNWYKLAIEDVIVVYDDLDLPLGRLRLRSQGGAGGHRGIESLLVHLGRDTFHRVRIGVGRPPEYMDAAAHVLSRFTTDELPIIEPAVKRAADAVEAIILQGAAKAATEFNK
ncbi:MAG: aminoacyl-tRNA hydrolase [Negativicutes bacterium]|nr:aminoacyl-tRNA hydrolase [Negativicutes bacterium]